MPLPKEYDIDEATSGRIRGTLTEEDGVTPIPVGTLTTLTLTLYVDDASQTILNGRNAQSILGVNGGVVDGAGVLTLTLAPADNPINDANLPFERHIALLEWTWGTGKAGKFELVLVVRNLAKVP